MAKSIVFRVGVLLTLSLASAALGAKVKIAVVTPLSGPLGPTGVVAQYGAELALRSMQDELRKADLEVTLVAVDEGNPTVTAQTAQKLVGDPEVLGVVGPTFSGTAMLVSDVLRPANIAMVSGAATAAEVTDRKYPNVNRVVARSDAQGLAMAEYLQEKTQLRKVLVISDNTTYGNSLADDFQDAAGTNKLNVVGRVNTQARSNFTDVITLAKDRTPDLIYFSGGPDGALPLLKELRAAGINTPLAGGSTFEDPTFIRTAGPLLRGVLYTTTFGPINKFTRSYTFTQNFKAAFDNKTPNVFSIFLYDATRVMLKALVEAHKASNGKPTRAEVSAAVRKVKLNDAVTGPIAFNDRGDRMRSPLFVMRFDETTVLPENLQVRIARPKIVKN